jgi:hypothetical protein
MEFLVYDNSSDSEQEEGCNNQIAVAKAELNIATEVHKPLAAKTCHTFHWQESDSSDDESPRENTNGEAAEGTTEEMKTTSMLPSALDLLGSGSGGSGEEPSFLQHRYIEPITLKEKILERCARTVLLSCFTVPCAYVLHVICS